MSFAGTREHRKYLADLKDQRVQGGTNITVVRPELPKRGASEKQPQISGNKTTLGMLLDRAMERQDRWRQE